MILYTPMAAESVFPADESDWKNRKNVEISHGMVTVEKHESSWIVASLNSTNPNDYLKPEYQPGSVWEKR
ncbi:YlzJ-like family protein [Alteribacillus sp. HJP-4]|uniref:YlzJ-like family protein n=1 Tax=Alteribacillus sp. HJP-4 TaxID=2775394 RepID=UPI0035CCE8BD